jgi:hypothetical protein
MRTIEQRTIRLLTMEKQRTMELPTMGKHRTIGLLLVTHSESPENNRIVEQ